MKTYQMLKIPSKAFSDDEKPEVGDEVEVPVKAKIKAITETGYDADPVSINGAECESCEGGKDDEETEASMYAKAEKADMS